MVIWNTGTSGFYIPKNILIFPLSRRYRKISGYVFSKNNGTVLNPYVKTIACVSKYILKI